jgi:D-amino-acid oxidase
MGRVVVVGAGVLGLSCAVRLLEDGHRVDVLARDLPRETTSAVAAAIWYPYRAWPADRVLAWARDSYGAFAALAAEQPESGVAMREGTEVVAQPAGLIREKPWWSEAVPDLRETVVVPGGYDGGWTFTAPLVEMPIYLDWLAGRVLALGGSITRLNLHALPTTGNGGPQAVVDCSGIGAKFLAADPSVHPVQGQVVLVEQVGLERWWLDSVGPEGPLYVVPRSHDVVVGGTSVEGEWSRTPSPDVASAILRRALRLVPELAGAEVLGHRVGLRPARPEVRLERVGDVVHCYGHGGAGVTLSWGCAREVAELLG